MAIKGSLAEAGPADVCQLLALGRKTGCLSIKDRSRFAQVFFEEGRIVSASMVNRRDRLGDMFVEDGVITHEQLRETIERQSRMPEHRVGQLLIRSELITRAQLSDYLRRQVEEAVYDLFTWSQGTFQFVPGERPNPDDAVPPIDTDGVLLEGARRVDEWGRIEHKIPSFDLLFEADRERIDGAAVELTPEQTRLVSMLDGTRTVQELIDETGFTVFGVGRAIFGLIQAGFAHQTGQRDTGATGGARLQSTYEHRNLSVAFYRAGLIEDALAEARRVLELQPEDAVARMYVALIAIQEGRENEAIRRLRSLLEKSGPDYGSFMNLAVALQRCGRLGDALLVLDEAEALEPDRPRVALLRGVVHMERGELEAAADAFEDYRERMGERMPSPSYYHHAALTDALADRLDSAEERLEEGLTAHPNSAPLLALAGAFAERRGDLAAAERGYRKAVESDPTLAQAHKNLGDIVYRKGSYDDALERYERAIALEPDLGDDVYARLGNLRYQRGEMDEAVDSWRLALERNQANETVRRNLEVVAHAQS